MAFGVIAVGASPASASSGNCESYDACLFYHQYGEGGYFGDGGNDNYGAPNYFTFGGCGQDNCDGDGQQVRNNAAYVWNFNSHTVRVFYYPNQSYNGPYQDIAGGTSANLNDSLRNNNASQQFL
jgi:hypothetical protein